MLSAPEQQLCIAAIYVDCQWRSYSNEDTTLLMCEQRNPRHSICCELRSFQVDIEEEEYFTSISISIVAIDPSLIRPLNQAFDLEVEAVAATFY